MAVGQAEFIAARAVILIGWALLTQPLAVGFFTWAGQLVALKTLFTVVHGDSGFAHRKMKRRSAVAQRLSLGDRGRWLGRWQKR